MQRLSPYADYLVINISSPNTPNLRLLQVRVTHITQHAQTQARTCVPDCAQSLFAMQSGSELQKILEQVMAEKKRAEAAGKSATAYPPVLIKIAPDLTKAQAEDIAAAALKYKVDGIIVSNTTVSRPLRVHNEQEVHTFSLFAHILVKRMTCALTICLFHQEMIAKEAGGLSGRPLLEMSTQLLSDMYRLTDGTPPLLHHHHHHRVEAEG